jgi:ATPase subunit of ABC transporter with duplicated ATPase domains
VSLVRLRNVGKRYDDNLIFHEIDFRVDEGERVGLIGKNGCGKTTLLNLILSASQTGGAGEGGHTVPSRMELPSEGTIELEPHLQVGYFSQFSELDGELSVEQELDGLFAEMHILEERLLELEMAIEEASASGHEGAGDALDDLIRQQADLLEEMERRGAWTYRRRIDTVLTKLGFRDAHRTCPTDQLSGGWRNRAALAKLLLQQPALLLLDEPTNFLDIEGLEWLEAWLVAYRGGVIIVSHDRDFIDHVATRIVEIESYHLHEYSAGFSNYVREKGRRFRSLEREFVHEEELLTLEAEAIAEREAALKNPSRALKRRLANIKKRVEPKPVERIVTGIYDGLHVPRALCRVEDLAKSYGEQLLFQNLSFELQRQDRIAVLGPNGCGKTTLLQILTGQVEPDGGHVVWAKGAEFVDFNARLAQLDLNDTVSHAVNVVGMAYLAQRRKVHQFLELLRFSEMDLYQRIGTLSGGQRARVALAQCLLSGAGAIVLDEPTNHLDLTTTQVMESALAHFPGAVIVATHDRFFVDKLANRLMVFGAEEAAPGEVRDITGNWSLYVASVQAPMAE